MIKVMWPAGATALLLAVLVASNPDETAHTRAMVAYAKQTCLDNRMVKAMCGGAMSLASLALTYDDHLLYSTAHLGEIETFGVFGRVMVVSE